MKRILQNGEEIPISEIGLDVLDSFGRRSFGTPWRRLISSAVIYGRTIVRDAVGWGLEEDHRAEAARRYLPEVEAALRRLTVKNCRRPTLDAVEPAMQLLLLAGHFTMEFAVVDDLAAFSRFRAGASDGGIQAEMNRRPKIKARDDEIHRLNGEIRDPKLSDSARARLIAPKLAGWKAKRNSRAKVGIGERTIRGVLAECRK